MRTPRALLPLAVVASLAAVASPASAADKHTAKASGGDLPPVVPSLIQTRVNRAENALERLTEYVDDEDAAHVVKVSKVIRRQTAAAWRGAKYYLRTAPPPVAEADSYKPSKKRSFKQDDGPVLPVVADQYASAVAVFGLVHDVSTQAVELTDGAHGDTLAGLSKTMFWALDKRDAMVQDAKSFEPAAPADPEAEAPEAAGGFAALMPAVTMGLDDEIQHIEGLRSDATDLNARGKSILRQAEVQILLSQRTINAIWPPAPVGD